MLDTQKVQDGFFVHTCEVTEGEFTPSMLGSTGHLLVDAHRRARIRAHHSATHIVHLALREFLGTHVKQAGSRVSEDTLRFDYSHFEAVSPEVLSQIERFANEYVWENHAVQTQVLPIEEARKTGAVALFGEKYGDVVRVVEIGKKSVEFCGGTHVSRSGDIGFISLVSEGGISAGVRRIECVAGRAAYDELTSLKKNIRDSADLLKSDPSHLYEKIEKTLLRSKTLEKEIEGLRGKLAQGSTGDLFDSATKSPRGFQVIVEKIPEADTETIKTMVDNLRVRLGSGVVALAAPQGDSALLVVGVTNDLTTQIHAGNLVKEAAKIGGGKGGGRADFAQAGGLELSKVTESLQKILELVQ